MPVRSAARGLVAFAALALVGEYSPASAQVYPAGFNDELVVTDLSTPTCFVFTPDGRMLIGQQAGTIRVFDGGQLLPTPLLMLAVEAFSEQGLLGMALAPGFPDPPHLFVCYTPYSGSPTGNVNRVERYTLSGNQVVPGSQTLIYDNLPNGEGFHVGGCIRFAPDGTLFLSTGDTGWLTPYPQDRSRLEGKLLRLNADGSIPADNPFVGVPGVRPEIYQWGLRNPFRFSVQPGTGVPFLGDVGYNAWEEINAGPPGANFGWPVFEGIADPPNPAYVDPLFTYDHGLGSAAIVGCVFYQGSNFPAEYTGNFFFFDHPRGHLGRMVLGPANEVLSVTMPFIQTVAAGNEAGPVDLQLGPDGALYYSTYSPGSIRRIYYSGAGNRVPTAVAAAQPTSGYAPLLVGFDGSGSYDVDGDTLTYQWDFGDGSSAGFGVTPVHTYTAAGDWTARLTVSDGRGGFDTALPIAITVGNSAPIVTIAQPADSTLFVVGQTVTFDGSAVDPEQGALPDSELHWTVLLHHLNHSHPVIQDLVGAGGSFVADSHGEALEDIHYEILAWARDGAGLLGEARVLVLPDLNQPQSVVRTYVVTSDDRDATSRLEEVRISGYDVDERFDYVSQDGEQLRGGVQFQLDLPVGSTIQQASLTVRAGPYQSASPTGGMLLRGYDVDSAMPFVDGYSDDLESHHPVMSSPVLWAAPTPWVPGDDAQSPDLAGLVQAFVDRPNYKPGAWFGLVLTEGSIEPGSYYGWADYADGGVGSRLRVVYLPPSGVAAPPVPSAGPARTPLALLPNLPNPFNPATSLPFELAQAADVRLTVVDLRGRVVRQLLAASLPAGRHSATWNGLDDAGRAVASGIYVARLSGLGASVTRTLTLVR